MTLEHTSKSLILELIETMKTKFTNWFSNIKTIKKEVWKVIN